MTGPASQLTRDDFASLATARERLMATRLIDRTRLAREVDRLFARRARSDFDAALDRLNLQIEKSAGQVESLRTLPLRLELPADLPISAHAEEITTALNQHPVIVVCGATGSGKTTQLPKLCLQAGRGLFGLIGHTQPRRIAARALANRLASEMQTTVGGAVGYQVRFTDRTGPQCRVKLMTDGILLKALESDPELRRYDTLIIDEAHERTLNIDFLLGILKRLVTRRHDLRVIVTSATIDPQKFAQFFAGAPIIEVSGRSYPVEVRYRPLYRRSVRNGDDEPDVPDEELEAAELSLPEGIVAAVRELDRDGIAGRGDTLVFLPGEKQIREAEEALSKARLGNTEILPLYARLSTGDQERIFQPHQARRIVLATNVAETSLTVPGIRYVVDSGLARISRYSVRNKVQRLPIEPISQASADQRSGRCGRESDGISIRLYDAEDFTTRAAFTPPEILRTNLASVILQMAVLDLGEPEDFPFPDPPDTRLLNDGYRLLQELKAVDEHRRVTSLGRQLAGLPVDPRLARMLLAAAHHHCVTEMLVIAAFLETKDPRERPVDAQQEADRMHAELADPRSDFVSVLNLWQRIAEQEAAGSKSQFRKWCRERFVSFIRVREWQELRDQLEASATELGLKHNQAAADYAQLHQAILAGFLGAIGELDEQREYIGARGVRFVIAPGTPLANKTPKWIVAASLLETTKLYARMVAAIEPLWIESVGAHLLKRSYSEPHWVPERGFVAAFESIALYGLTLAARRRVNYGRVAPADARNIFVREALVQRNTSWQAPFLQHNAALRAQVEDYEAKIRRHDVLVDEEQLCAFYLARLPGDVNSTATLERWLKEAAQADPNALQMSLQDLLARPLPDDLTEQYPDFLQQGPNRLALAYRFDTTAAEDGVTLSVPAPVLASLDMGALAWHIPGLRLEKVTSVLRALPKAIRKAFVPVPQHAAQALASMNPGNDFFIEMARWISNQAGQAIQPEEIAALPLPEYLKLNIRVTDLEGRTLRMGRDLVEVRRATRQHTAKITATAAVATQGERLHRSWDFGPLPVQHEVERGGVRFTVYPAIVDRDTAVSIMDLGSAEQAQRASRRGLVRLAAVSLAQQYKFTRSRFAQHNELTLLGRLLETSRPLADELADRAFQQCFFPADQPLPRDQSQFDALVNSRRGALDKCAGSMAGLALEILQALRNVRQLLESLKAPAAANAVGDVTAQLRALLPKDFLQTTAQPWLAQFPRYLKAAARRLERVAANAPKDAALMKQLTPFTTALQQLSATNQDTLDNSELQTLRWMIEEFRVSLYAQDLRTVIPVSEKRLTEQLERAKAEARRG